MWLIAIVTSALTYWKPMPPMNPDMHHLMS